MASISMTSAQARALATWSSVTGGGELLSVEAVDPSLPSESGEGDILVRRGDAFARISQAGAFKDAQPGRPGSFRGDNRSNPEERFVRVQKGVKVRARVDRRLAIELAANGAGDEEHALGWELLEALRSSDEPLIYSATVAFPPPPDRAVDPYAPSASRSLIWMIRATSLHSRSRTWKSRIRASGQATACSQIAPGASV